MNIEIVPLTPERKDDYLRFFDEVAFTDHPDWSWCYCIESHTPEALEKTLNEKGKEGRRAQCAAWIEDGTQTGYLAYRDGAVVGWLNAGDKAGYARVREDNQLWTDADAPGRTLLLTCFTIAPAMRGKGIATRLIDRAIADAAAGGYAFIEAYPLAGASDCFMNYRGPVKLYEKRGFEKIAELEWCSVMRKALV